MYCYDVEYEIPGYGKAILKIGYQKLKDWYSYCEPQHKKWWVDNIKKDWVIFDVGAHIGQFTIIFGKFASKVCAFEPTDTVDMLKINLKANNIEGIEIIQKAVGERSGLINDFVYKIWGLEPEKREFDFITLDDFVTENNNMKVDAIKIDVDSYDYEVLLGAKNLLTTQSPFVIVELNRALKLRNKKIEDAIKYMNSLGYKNL